MNFPSPVTAPVPFLRYLLVVILAQGGILVDRLTPPRLLVIGLIALNIALTYFFGHLVTPAFAWGFFALMFAVRYGFLFGSFGPNGIAARLIARYGEDRGYARYEAMTAFMFFYRSTSFQFLLEQTAGQLPLFDQYAPLLKAVGWVFIVVATVVNVWASLIVGVDVYYY